MKNNKLTVIEHITLISDDHCVHKTINLNLNDC